MSWTRQRCDKCGADITFFTDARGRHIPVHADGQACNGWGNYGSWLHVRLHEGVKFEFPFVNHPAYLNPNAKCPVCGEAVFFYQSPNGGLVFFDELGTPWKKHGCNDEPKVRREFRTEESRKHWLLNKSEAEAAGGGRAVPAWLRDGWEPFHWLETHAHQIGIEVSGELPGAAGAVTVRIRLQQFSTEASYQALRSIIVECTNLVTNPTRVLRALEASPVLVRKSEQPGRWLVSTFVLEKNEVVPLAWEMEEKRPS